ncbi:MAG: hypothetical protein EHM77_08915 [Planctomycetaceae bacterium]|nr:MAG: hypothetical protein EHM77_08915 [Planctomycetaceae bacterium]
MEGEARGRSGRTVRARTRRQLFLFVNKRRDRLKALHWARDGFVIWYNRLEAGVFEVPAAARTVAVRRARTEGTDRL